MADMPDNSNLKRRGRYKEFLCHCNPYKFPAARRRKNIRLKGPKSNPRPVVSSCNGIGPDSVSEDLGDCDTGLNPSDTDILRGDFSEYYGDDKMEDIGDEKGYDFELGESAAARVDEDDLLDSYERYVKEADSSLDSFSDCESMGSIESDNESVEEQCKPNPDELLYSGAPLTCSSSVVLLLSFVMRHKLTREAFKDLLAVIEAHCPRPNNCKTTVNQLLEFVTQSKGHVVKHYFCSYCKVYYGKDVEHGGGICLICGQIIPKSSSNGFFIEVPIERQLQTFFLGKFPTRP